MEKTVYKYIALGNIISYQNSFFFQPFIPSSLNLEWDYDQDYPAMFNIILWIMVAWIISVFVIAYGMWNMDPGRDSIIYRMTSQRLKKD